MPRSAVSRVTNSVFQQSMTDCTNNTQSTTCEIPPMTCLASCGMAWMPREYDEDSCRQQKCNWMSSDCEGMCQILYNKH